MLIAERLLHLNVDVHPFARREPIRVARVALAWMHHAICSLTGHELLTHFEPRRLSLECMKCGWRSRGWSIPVRTVQRKVELQVRSVAPGNLVAWHRGR
jgi:hypothetical protein